MLAIWKVAVAFFVGALSAWPYIALVVVLFGGWNMWVENPRIRKEARSGYVLEVTAAAARAELEERQRQVNAAVVATSKLKETLDKQKEADAATLEAQKQDLRDYAAKLKTQKRSSPITQSDIDWLRK